MIECNNVIPQIISINTEEKNEEIVNEFAHKYGIEPSHRIVLYPEEEELTVDQIHEMQNDIKVSFSKQVLVALIGVDASSIEVQNSLLKSIEEDSERIIFLLIVKNASRLLSTILSRCTLIPPDSKSINSQKSIDDESIVFSFATNSEATKESAVELIDRYLTSPKLKSSVILKQLLLMRKLIIDNNVNPSAALDNILIFLGKKGTMN